MTKIFIHRFKYIVIIFLYFLLKSFLFFHFFQFLISKKLKNPKIGHSNFFSNKSCYCKFIHFIIYLLIMMWKIKIHQNHSKQLFVAILRNVQNQPENKENFIVTKFSTKKRNCDCYALNAIFFTFFWRFFRNSQNWTF